MPSLKLSAAASPGVPVVQVPVNFAVGDFIRAVAPAAVAEHSDLRKMKLLIVGP